MIAPLLTGKNDVRQVFFYNNSVKERKTFYFQPVVHFTFQIIAARSR